MPNTNGSVDLNSVPPEAEENLRRMAEEHGETGEPPENEPVDVVTAFTVVILPTGEITIADPSTPLRPQRGLTNNDIYGACQVILKNQTVAETAETATVLIVRELQAQMQAQMKRAQDAHWSEKVQGMNLRG